MKILKVHIVLKEYPYEGDEVVAVYADEDKAARDAQARNDQVIGESEEMDIPPYCRFRVIHKEVRL